MREKEHSSLFAIFGKMQKQSSNSSGNRGGKNDQRVPNVSKEDFARCRQENRCLKCKEIGHVAKECSKPVRSNF